MMGGLSGIRYGKWETIPIQHMAKIDDDQIRSMRSCLRAAYHPLADNEEFWAEGFRRAEQARRYIALCEMSDAEMIALCDERGVKACRLLTHRMVWQVLHFDYTKQTFIYTGSSEEDGWLPGWACI
ncbi:MAG: hypothetical protein VX624_05865 [Pseudomonadota bacterium]|nr:hypothetical protein [Actinomycetota bacterium]MED6309410.1 hypothetical protein [Pseudomonadota bacterium]